MEDFIDYVNGNNGYSSKDAARDLASTVGKVIGAGISIYANSKRDSSSNSQRLDYNSGSVNQRVISIIADKLCLNTYEVSNNSHFENDLGVDSLDAVEIIMTIESEFNITIPDEIAYGFKRVGDLVDYVEVNAR